MALSKKKKDAEAAAKAEAEKTQAATDEAVKAGAAPVAAASPDVEVAAKTTDTGEAETSTFEKDFVVPTRDIETGDAKAIHAANEVTVRQAAVNAGLRLTGDISHTSKKKTSDDGRSTVLAYRSSAVPAHTLDASDPAATEAVNPEGSEAADSEELPSRAAARAKRRGE